MTNQEKEYLESLPYDAMGDYSFLKNFLSKKESDILKMESNNVESGSTFKETH